MAMTKGVPAHVLVVDDEPDIRSILCRGLKAEGYVVSEACNKAQILSHLETQPVDLITLDLDLGTERGLELAREIRSRRNVPIVMITGKGEPSDRLIGLEYGADDYVAKPFKMREVILRIRNVLRRYELEARIDEFESERQGEGERYAFETGTLDVGRRELRSRDGKHIDLTDAEFDLLTIFLRNSTRVLSRDDIMELLKGRPWSPLDRTIDGHVARLRRKIEPESEEPRLIKSVRGVGYVFAAEARRYRGGEPDEW